MTTFTAPIVGMFFRLRDDSVPAPAIIANLPSDTPLSLVAEPDNAYDANAIKVYILSADIPHGEEIEVACAAQGTASDELYSTDWHLGYVDSKKTGAAAYLAPLLSRVSSCVMFFDAAGKPGIKVEISEDLPSAHRQE